MREEELNVAAVILTYNEERHIERCITSLRHVVKEVYVVDSLSSDRTAEIAQRLGAHVVLHKWPGNQAEQFNWALDHLPLSAEWVLRLDADEYLSPELQTELRERLPQTPESVTAFSIPLGRVFCGKRLRHGIVGGVRIIRLFRNGCARYERRMMDEHLSITRGEVANLRHPFIDDSLLTIGEFVEKHNRYAEREAALLLDEEFNLSGDTSRDTRHGSAVEKKRAQKNRYARLPLFWRAAAYFFYRYFLRLGCLDGKEGFLWDFMQGWWYRTLVDAKVDEIKRACGNDKEQIKNYLRMKYNISLLPPPLTLVKIYQPLSACA